MSELKYVGLTEVARGFIRQLEPIGSDEVVSTFINRVVEWKTRVIFLGTWRIPETSVFVEEYVQVSWFHKDAKYVLTALAIQGCPIDVFKWARNNKMDTNKYNVIKGEYNA